MFEEILAALPSGCASLQRKGERKEFPEEVCVVPSNGSSAQFGAMFFGGMLYGAFFGRAPFLTTYEAPWELNLGRRDGFDKQLGALKKMCEAVVAGRCEHRIRMLSLVGIISASDGSTFRVDDLLAFHRRRLRKTLIYEPYERGSDSVALSPSIQSV